MVSGPGLAGDEQRTATGARSLAEDLRNRDDVELGALLRVRPDALWPVPGDITELAARLSTRPSVAAALDNLDALGIAVLTAACTCPEPITVEALADYVGRPAAETVDALRTAGLIWGDAGGLRVVGAARELLVPPDRGPAMAALRPLVAEYAKDPAALQHVLGRAPDRSREALWQLLRGPVIGTLQNARRARTTGAAQTPVDWLLAHDILVPVGTDQVAVPAEIVAILRSGEPVAVLALDPPTAVRAGAVASAIDQDAVDRSGAAQAQALIRLVGELGLMWAGRPGRLLRTGGLAAREHAAAARHLRVDPWLATLVIEVAHAAGLVGPAGDTTGELLPTEDFDSWLSGTTEQRWAPLAVAWFDLPRRLHANPDEASPAAPLSPTLAAPAMPELRAIVLGLLADSSTPLAQADLLAALDWHLPRRTSHRMHAGARAVLAEAAEIGLLGGRSLCTAGRVLVEHANRAAEPRDTIERLVDTLSRALPEPVATFIAQADMTAVVPGTPQPGLERLLRLVADPESVGAASVYRFSQASIQRALDSGLRADQLIGQLSACCASQLPQPLTYLITEAARSQARLRVGAARSYLRCEDPATLAHVLASPSVASLGLLEVGQNAIACQADPGELLAALRAAGFAPAAEDEAGQLVPLANLAQASRRRGRPHREPGGSDPGAQGLRRTPPEALVRGAVRAMRVADHGGAPVGGPGREIPAGTAEEIAAVLRGCISGGSAAWITYADAAGSATTRLVDPINLYGGYLTAFDRRADRVRNFALARIVGGLAATG